MIARGDYVGPLTKSAEAMFARAERRALRSAGEATTQAPPVRETRPASVLRDAVDRLGLKITTLRQWEDAGLIAFERRNGRRIVDAAALECLALVATLRRAGFSVREIAWLSDTLPPSAAVMRDALEARQTYLEAARTRTIVGVIAKGGSKPVRKPAHRASAIAVERAA
ncbi:MerR family transcriptional regulator [Caulobacter soli]|uniref:MerR family transcriptional regulator n=1 Tax=Caulobacter soli TaxID=2708539 RepID=UPI0013E9FA7A|nr:MerR family transcriptional regulator [Caulobacter soli]